MSNCKRCGEENPGEIHTCSPPEPETMEEFKAEPAVMLVIQSLEYAGNVLQALPFSKLHPVTMQLITILTGIFVHEMLPSAKTPVDVQ